MTTSSLSSRFAGPTFDGGSTLQFTDFDIVSSAPGPYADEGGTVMTFTLKGTQESDTLVFDLIDASGKYIEVGLESLDTSGLPTNPYGLTIVGDSTHIIPEPATIALLGLGGLFLRRRRKSK